jgi:uncharacterized membrane protein YhfC
MNQPVQISNGWVAAMIAALVFDILYPLALGVFARRRLGVSWRYFGYGALIFVLFQLISRVPITLAIQALIAPQLQASRVALMAWIAISALTAGLFEELGRYIGYRWLLKREAKTWAQGVMYGLGHGGIESMLLIAGLVAITLIQVLALARTDLSMLPLTAEQRALTAQQLAAIAAQPSWVPLLGAWERLWTIPLHVALSHSAASLPARQLALALDRDPGARLGRLPGRRCHADSAITWDDGAAGARGDHHGDRPAQPVGDLGAARSARSGWCSGSRTRAAAAGRRGRSARQSAEPALA